MNPIKDLFNITRYITPKGRTLDERSGLIAYFCDQTKREPKVIAIRLSHYSLSELYALQASYKDRLQRQDKDTADRYFWWISRTK